MRNTLAILGGLALAIGNIGCSSSDGNTCGSGTTEVNGECVASGDDITCATGTTLSGTECVPDGTVICETGTTYDDTTGTCVPDITGCAAGTVLVDGECVPEDETLEGDVQEPAEPNGPEVGATVPLLTLPTEGNSVVIEGCVGPTPDYDLSDNGDADLDFYVFDVAGPSLLDITVDGVGGMSGAFQLIALSGAASADGWSRLGINLVGDTTQAQAYVPAAGQYLLILADSRGLFLGEGVGDGTSTCYFATIAHVATPTATAISGAQATGTMSADAQFFSYTATDGDSVDVALALETVSESITGSITTMVDGVYSSSAETGSPANDSVLGLSGAAEVVYVVETSFSLQLDPVDFTLDIDVTGGVSLGAADTTNTVTVDNVDGTNFYFDGTAGDVVFLDFDGTTANENMSGTLYNSRGDALGSIFSNTTAGGSWMQIPATGRYTVMVSNNDADTGTTDVDFTRTHRTPDTLTYGTPATGVTLGDDGLSFYRLSISNAIWLDAFLATTDFGGTGVLHRIVPTPPAPGAPAHQVFNLDNPFGSERQAISDGLTEDILLVVEDDDFAAATGTPTFDLSVGDQTFTNSMTVTEAAPVALTGVTLAADTSLYYYFLVDWDADYTVTVQGSEDLVLDLLTEDASVSTSVDDGGAGAAESFNDATTQPTWVAFEVYEASGTADTITVDIDVIDATYSTAFDYVDLSNACLTGTRVDLDEDGLSAAIDIGFTFNFFGTDFTQMILAENGWMTFDTAFPGTGAFDQWGGDSLAVYDSDEQSELRDLCIDKQTDHVVVQWRIVESEFGFFDQNVEFQLILWNNGAINFNYGSDSDFSFTGTVQVMGMNNDGSDLFERPFYDNNLSMLFSPN